MSKNKEKNKRIKKIVIYRVLLFMAFLAAAALNYLVINKLNIIPAKYLFAFIGGSILIALISIFIFFKRKKLRLLKALWTIVLTIITIGYIVALLYLYKTNSFFKGIKDINYRTEIYNVIVLKESTIESIEDLDSKNIQYVDNESLSYDKALEKIDKKITINKIIVGDYEVLLTNLYNEKTESILIEDTNLKQVHEIYPNAKDKIKIIKTFKIKIKQDSIVKKVNVAKKPFNIYISGLDTYGSIANTARSDVNMIITVNPNTNQILLTSIPRDYYVQLRNTTGYKDKLTHAGVYGIESSVGTLEDLFDIDINYYIKVNFSTLIKIIDAIGGVDVYNSYAYTGHLYTYFPEGYVHLNGNEALEFSRTRKTLREGDNDRIKNQQAVVDGIITKMTSKAIITKYSSLLDSLSGNFVTNMSDEEITSLIKLQLDNMPNWTITSNVLTGYGSSEFTYTYPGQRLYVMIQNEESVNNAKDLINKVLNGEMLDNSYKENTGTKSPVHGSAPVTPTTPKQEETAKTEENRAEEETDNENEETTNENENQNNENENNNQPNENENQNNENENNNQPNENQNNETPSEEPGNNNQENNEGNN